MTCEPIVNISLLHVSCFNMCVNSFSTSYKINIHVQTCCKMQQKRYTAKNTPLLALYRPNFTYFSFTVFQLTVSAIGFHHYHYSEAIGYMYPFPWNKLACFPVLQKSKIVFLCSLFPDIVLKICPLFPCSPWNKCLSPWSPKPLGGPRYWWFSNSCIDIYSYSCIQPLSNKR